jgi:glutathione synthase/RimK-type ligase-like ATP-grasp enzyme
VRVALVSAASAKHLDDDLPPLVRALEGAGACPEIVAWDDDAVEWRAFDAAVVRSAWDAAARRAEFVAWARAMPVRLMNGPDVLAWNTEKTYLLDLASKGVPITPTTYVRPGDAIDLPEGEIVVKPAVSAGSLDTARYAAAARAEAEEHVRRLVGQGRVTMVQPYQRAVDAHGETGLIYFGGVFSHAIRKGPILVPGTAFVEGLFAQETISPRTPAADERAIAERTLDAVPFGRDALLYARVDIVRGTDGAPIVLELELTEPSVYLKHGAGAAERFARAICARLAS